MAKTKICVITMMQQGMQRQECDDELNITSAVVGRNTQTAEERQREGEPQSSSAPH